MNILRKISISAAALVVGFVAIVGCSPSGQPAADPLVVYVAAGLKVPIEKIKADYEKAYGTRIQVQYGGSNTLLANLSVNPVGDVFIPADSSYVEIARSKKLIDEVFPLATMQPVLVVKKGNPKSLTSLQDLLDGKGRLAQANPDAAAIGKLTRTVLERRGTWDKLKEKTIVFKPTVTEVATDVSVGSVDAAVVWDVTAKQFSDLEIVALPEFAGIKADVSATILAGSKQPTAALRFVRFVASRDRGLPRFREEGFAVVAGDEWAEKPDLRLLSGAMLRPAIEETVKQFEQREGVQITRVYNGCGILVGQMKAGEHPDAYFACETSFMQQVTNLFDQPEDISSNQLVIVVPKGNPKGIKTLKDLGKPGLKVGIGHEQQCALGALTKETLVASKLYDEIRKNVVVEVPAGDMLINQLLTGSLDVALAYISNTAANPDKLEAFAIDIPCAFPTQPIAIGKESRYKHQMARLIDRIKTEQSREVFVSQGFGWKVGTAATTRP